MIDPVTLSAADLAGRRVLVVDDVAGNRAIFSHLLERIGVPDIALAVDGEDGLINAKSCAPDLIIVDLMMPKMDGYALMEALRKRDDTKDIPILVQSALAKPEDRRKAFQCGATDYISKPINIQQATARIKVHLASRIMRTRFQGYQDQMLEDLFAARRLQDGIQPTDHEFGHAAAHGGCDAAFRSVPSLELGGDCFGGGNDSDGNFYFWLADFAGHGAQAALNVFRLHGILDGLADNAIHSPTHGSCRLPTPFDPAKFLAEVNNALAAVLPMGKFATLVAGVVDRKAGQLRYASAGGTPIMVRNPGKPPVFGDPDGVPCGMAKGMTYDSRWLPLEPGGLVVLASDAACELPLLSGGLLGQDGFEKMLSGIETGNPASFLGELETQLLDLNKFDDDYTAIAVKRLS